MQPEDAARPLHFLTNDKDKKLPQARTVVTADIRS
jgi:hypothetical protein